ncbi:hypothetical protein H4219_003072, partial [Mycoemilia scoparia]
MTPFVHLKLMTIGRTMNELDLEYGPPTIGNYGFIYKVDDKISIEVQFDNNNRVAI